MIIFVVIFELYIFIVETNLLWFAVKIYAKTLPQAGVLKVHFARNGSVFIVKLCFPFQYSNLDRLSKYLPIKILQQFDLLNTFKKTGASWQ